MVNEKLERAVNRADILSREKVATECAVGNYLEQNPEVRKLYNSRIVRKVGEYLAIV